MSPDGPAVTVALFFPVALAVGWAWALGRLDLLKARASEATGRAVLLKAEVSILTQALERRDMALADLRRELAAIHAVLQDDRPDPALEALELLARNGHGPAFTQGAIHTHRRVEAFGPLPGDFAAAIVRMGGASP